jgi:hypothetical protein
MANDHVWLKQGRTTNRGIGGCLSAAMAQVEGISKLQLAMQLSQNSACLYFGMVCRV